MLRHDFLKERKSTVLLRMLSKKFLTKTTYFTRNTFLKKKLTKLMRITFIAFFATFLFSTKSVAQYQERQIFVYNIALGGITSGIGAAINKKKEDKFLPVFFRGFKYGCVGGLFLYGGKKISYQINRQNNLAWGWPSKLVHSYGASIIESAALNEKHVFSKLSFPIGFVRFNIQFNIKVKGKM
jgi:hypothetical protein